MITATHIRTYIQTRLMQCAHYARAHWWHTAALFVVLAWCMPYFTSGTRIEWGDFSFFAQAYEAIRVSIVDYHQFPWWNPWMSGGVPLYANPQMGVFSVQTIFVLIFGASIGLKVAIAFYTFAGYFSMILLLRKYFKVEPKISALLGLLWLFSSFFVAHLPPHFTFVWYMLAPLFIYQALTLKNWRSGALFGLSVAVMALSAIHNPFFHITLVCAVILGFRLVRAIIRKNNVRSFVIGLGSTVAVFAVLAGHRALLTVKNVQDFPRDVYDPTIEPITSFLGVIMPLSRNHNLSFFTPSPTPYGFGEVTGTIGIFASIAAFIGLLYVIYKTRLRWQPLLKQYSIPLGVLLAGLLCFATGFGAIDTFTPYNVLKHIPVFENMRVASRWFIFFDLALLIFIGTMLKKAPKQSFYRFVTVSLLVLGVLELLVLNLGYQNKSLNHDLAQPRPGTPSSSFIQTSMYGSLQTLPNGTKLPGTDKGPIFYREYEATLFNMGVLQSNDSLVNLNIRHDSPRCPWEKGCDLVLTRNAKITHWSPNKIVLERTAKGPIRLNINNSNYFTVNDQRGKDLTTAEPFREFVITNPEKTITVKVQPALGAMLK